MLDMLKNWFTSRDNLTYSFTKLLGASAGVTMICKFSTMVVPDFVGFGVGISGIIAALAIKYAVEEKKDCDKEA